MIKTLNEGHQPTRLDSAPQRMPRVWAPPIPDSEEPEAYESLHDLLAVLLRRWKITLASTLMFVGIAVLACFILTPQYSSTAVLEVNRAEAAPGSVSADAGLVTDDVKTEVETDTNILQADSIALEVIQNLQLGNSPPFNRVQVLGEKGLSLDHAPKTREKYLHLFAKSLKVASVPDSRLIQITFRNSDPAIAAKVTNALSETFISDAMKRRLASSSDTSFWISKQIEGLKNRVRVSEQALADFQHQTGLTGVDIQPSGQQGKSGVTVQAHNAILDRLNTLNQERTTAEANRISSETVYRLTQGQDPETVLGLGSMSTLGGGSVLSQGGGLDLLRTLRTQEVALKSEYADISTRFGAQNPRIVQVTSQISAMDAEINGEMRRIQKRAENDFRYAQGNEVAINAELVKQQSLADKFTDDAVQLQLLAQEAFSNRAIYQSLFSELNQANVAAGIHATRLDVVSHALVSSTPDSPNYVLLLAGALAVGLFVGIVGSFVIQSVDQSIGTARDAETTSHLPVLSELPALLDQTSAALGSGETELIGSPQSHFSESFHFLCTVIVAMFRPNARGQALLVMSPQPGDGKSTVAYNLAIALAQRGERVLLIDGDMRSPALHTYFGSGQQAGLSEALRTGRIWLSERAIEHSILPNLSLLPAMTNPELPAALFSSVAFEDLLSEARSSFGWTIIDSPPALLFADATIMAEKVDGVLSVVRSGVTPRNVLKRYTTLLLRTHAPLLGLVLNGATKKSEHSVYASNYAPAQKTVKHA